MNDGMRKMGFAKTAANEALKMGITKVEYKIEVLTTVSASVEVVVVLYQCSPELIVTTGYTLPYLGCSIKCSFYNGVAIENCLSGTVANFCSR